MATKGHRITHVLMLGLDHYLAEQLAIWLALEGIRLIAIGPERDRTVLLKQEINAFGGTFDGLSLKPGDLHPLETSLESLIYQVDGIDAVISISDERNLSSGICRPQVEQRGSTAHLVKTYQAICSQYYGVRRLQRVIHVVLTHQTPPIDPAQTTKTQAEQNYLYLVDSEPWVLAQTSSRFCQIPVEWIGRIVLEQLLGSRSGTTLLEITAKTASFRTVETEDTPIKLGTLLPVGIQENGTRQTLIAQQSFKRGDRILKTSGQMLNVPTAHSIQLSTHTHLEPYGAVRLITHSCEPNLGVKTNSQGIPDFYAFQDIEPGDTLTVDVAMIKAAPQPGATLENSLPCSCGAASCRGQLGYYAELSETLKQHYDGFVANAVLESTLTLASQ